MAAGSISIDSILEQVKQLGQMEKLSLLEKMVSLIKKDTSAKEQPKLSALAGLGAEIWKGTDAAGYIENERQWD